MVYAYYFNCDPIATEQIKKKDQIFPIFIMQVMGDYPGVPGLFVAGVFSGALSTVSSGLNSLSAVFLRDFFQSLCGWQMTSKTEGVVIRVTCIVIGLVVYAIIFVIKFLPGVLEAAITIIGIAGGPVVGTFTLGMLFPFVNSLGAFLGTLSSLLSLIHI